VINNIYLAVLGEVGFSFDLKGLIVLVVVDLEVLSGIVNALLQLFV
jgi:hypothetical protein